MKRWLWLFGLFLPGILQAQPVPKTGLVFDDPGYEALPFSGSLGKGPLPAKISMEAWCPAVQTQGPYSTCVGFACGYYLHTILEARSRRLTTRSQITPIAFSPGYVYEKAKSSKDYDCSQGISLVKALEVMKEYGSTPIREYPYPSCGKSTGKADQSARTFRIAGYDRVFLAKDTPSDKTRYLKQALADGQPVVVGLAVPASFYFTRSTWQPAPGDNPADPKLTGHALCVIGYDDEKGAFRIINSFGKNWADSGYCWITYTDMGRFVRYGFVIRKT